MPVMIPPGQGTTVTLSGPQAQAVVPAAQGPGPQARLTAPPSPFRQAHGPDVLIMPHTEEQTQQPQQFRRPGRLLRLARRALKLTLSREDLDPWVQSFAAARSAAETAVQQRTGVTERFRRAIRMSRDTVGLHAHVVENPHDFGRWGILADAMDDAGKFATAQSLRVLMHGRALDLGDDTSPEPMALAEHPEFPGHTNTMTGMSVRGSIGQVPVDLMTRHSIDDHERRFAHSYSLTVLGRHPTTMLGTVELPAHIGQQVAQEFDRNETGAPHAAHADLLRTVAPHPMEPRPESVPERLARRVLKLALSRRDVEPFTKSFAANPGDDAPHLVFADYLDEAGDPRAAIVRQQVSRGRQTYGRPWFISPPESFDSTGGGYDFRRYVAGGTRGDGGWMALVPHKEKPQVMAIWRPDASSENHESSIYRAVFSPDHAHEIARHVGLDSYVAAKFPDHAKPKILTDPS